MASLKRRVSHAKEIYCIVIIVMAFASVLFSVWGPGGYLEMKKARAELEAHRARVEALQQSNRQRLKAIEALKSDREVLERYAREKGYGRKDEIIQRLPQEPTPPKP